MVIINSDVVEDKLVYKCEKTPVNNGGEMCRAPRGSVYVAYSGCSTM